MRNQTLPVHHSLYKGTTRSVNSQYYRTCNVFKCNYWKYLLAGATFGYILTSDYVQSDGKQMFNAEESRMPNLSSSSTVGNVMIGDDLLSSEVTPAVSNSISVGEEAPRTYKFVLTGGPCAGKTTALSYLSDRLRSMGFNVYVVPEAATLLILGGGLYSKEMTPEQQIRFQASLMRVQMALEDNFLKLASLSKKPTVILCDRGLMDGSAYISKEDWQVLLDDNGWSQVALRDKRYDACVHMVTAAIGAQDFYQVANNQARSESLQQAIEVDFKVINAWVGHKHLRIIDNSTDFKEKINRAYDAISSFIGLPSMAASQQRKFLVMDIPEKIPVPVEQFDIEQVYLRNSATVAAPGIPVTFNSNIGGTLTTPPPLPSSTTTPAAATTTTTTTEGAAEGGATTAGFTFIRKRGQNNKFTYTTSRRVNRNGKVAILEKQITGAEYQSLLNNYADPDRNVIKKKLKCFLYNNQYYELIEFIQPISHLRVLQVTMDKSRKADLPPFIRVGQEVTGDDSFQSYRIARKI